MINLYSYENRLILAPYIRVGLANIAFHEPFIELPITLDDCSLGNEINQAETLSRDIPPISKSSSTDILETYFGLTWRQIQNKVKFVSIRQINDEEYKVIKMRKKGGGFEGSQSIICDTNDLECIGKTLKNMLGVSQESS